MMRNRFKDTILYNVIAHMLNANIIGIWAPKASLVNTEKEKTHVNIERSNVNVQTTDTKCSIAESMINTPVNPEALARRMRSSDTSSRDQACLTF
jgi:hypothetical protein